MTSCIIILHSTVQKQLHHVDPSSWPEDLSYAHTCLLALSFCGTHDPVARKFQDELQPLFAGIAAYQPTGRTRPSPEAEPTYLLTIPPEAEGSPHRALSLSLLAMLCQPFSNPATQTPVDEMAASASGWRADATRFAHSRLMDRLHWDFEKSLPFRWDVKGAMGLEIPALAGRYVAGGKFLGHSPEPSGWMGGTEQEGRAEG